MKTLCSVPVTKGHKLYISIYMECPEEADPQRQKGCQCLAGAGSQREWRWPATQCKFAFFLGVSFFVLELDISDG